MFFFFIFLFLSISVFFMKNLFFVWCILEFYGIFYLFFIFLIRSKKFKFESFIYFGLMNLFMSVVLILSILLDFSLLSFFSVLGKMGTFPLMDWVIKFLKNLKWFEIWIFFSLNKVIPLYIIFEFLDKKFFFMIFFFMYKFFFSVKGCILSEKLLNLMIWSSIGSTGFFILSKIMIKDLFLWGFLLSVYSLISFFVFFLSQFSKSKILFFLILLLFGMPPISMFLFKVKILIFFFPFFSMFYFYFFIFLFFCFGFSYFFLFFKSAQNLLIFKINFTLSFLVSLKFLILLKTLIFIFWYVF